LLPISVIALPVCVIALQNIDLMTTIQWSSERAIDGSVKRC